MGGVRLINIGWNGPAVVRDHRTLKRTGGDDDVPCVDLAIGGFQRVAAAAFVGAEARYFNTGADRSRNLRRIVDDEAHDVWMVRKPVRVGSRIRLPRQLKPPVWQLES